MKRYLKILIVISFSLLLFGCEKNDNELVMVTEAGFAPYEYYENNEIVGVDVDIAKEIAAYLGKELVIKDVAFDSLTSELNSDKADFAAAGLSITEERKKSVDFSIEYAKSKQVLVVRTDYEGISKVDDLRGKTIAVQLGSVADLWVDDTYPESTLKTHKKFLTAAEEVKAGKADCLIMDSLPAEQLVKKNQDLKILDVTLFTDRYAIAVKKGNTEMLDAINTVITRLIEEGKIEEYTLNHSS